jgi:hypothetical protein
MRTLAELLASLNINRIELTPANQPFVGFSLACTSS